MTGAWRSTHPSAKWCTCLGKRSAPLLRSNTTWTWQAPRKCDTHLWPGCVIVSKDLSWANHIEDIRTKANKSIGLIKRVCARDVVDANTRKLLYCAVVRPKLEYASCVWSPYSAKQRKLIENVQRRATKFILNYPPRDVTYRDRLISLNILPLEHRRELYNLTLYKIKNNLINVTCNQYLSRATNPYATRNFDPNNYNKIVSNNQNWSRISIGI
jgi:hypothetical protein